MASWLDARAAAAQGTQSQWLVRIEDLDADRCSDQAAKTILRQLEALGLQADAPPEWQSQRTAHYAAALRQLRERGLAYPCACSRASIENVWRARGVPKPRFGTLVYPGTCRHETRPVQPRVWRLNTAAVAAEQALPWTDRCLGAQSQNVAQDVGDFALLRGDGHWSYQLGCVVDDALQGITHVVRGQDLADNTARQLLLQNALGYASPAYLHVPLAVDAQGEKLSKTNHAASIDARDSAEVLLAAAAILGLPCLAPTAPAALLRAWIPAWKRKYPLVVS